MVRVRHVPAEGGPPRVAWAIGRQVGPAVVRNRVRRRLRAVAATLEPPLAPGDWLVGVRPAGASASSSDLRRDLDLARRRLPRGRR